MHCALSVPLLLMLVLAYSSLPLFLVPMSAIRRIGGMPGIGTSEGNCLFLTGAVAWPLLTLLGSSLLLWSGISFIVRAVIAVPMAEASNRFNGN
jgi:hypothetical protein